MKERNNKSPERRDNDGLHKRRGIWYYCLTIRGRRRFFSTNTRNYQDARMVRSNAIKAQLENRLPTDAAKQRFETLLVQVLEDRKPHLAENTIRLEKERSGPLLKHFAGRRVSEIDADAIRAYQTARARQVSPRTVNLECKVLRIVLKAAKVWGTVSDDFKPLKENRRGPGRALDEAQEVLLFDTACSKPGWDAAFFAAMVAANSTMRGCEIKGLRLQDVNLPGEEVTIRNSKTDGGIRDVPLNPGARWGIARLLERANALGSIAPEHFLLPRFLYRQTKTADHGTGYDPTRPQKTWRTAWRALVKETTCRAGKTAYDAAISAGCTPEVAENERRKGAAPLAGLRFHDLRHLAITKLAETGASDQTIMSIAGHLDRAMLEHYSHIRAAAKRKAVESIRSYVPGKIPGAVPKRVQ
jgi:integrase